MSIGDLSLYAGIFGAAVSLAALLFALPSQLPSWRKRRELRIVTPEEFASWGWSTQKLLAKIAKTDAVAFGQTYSEAEQGSHSVWAEIWDRNPETWMLLTYGPRSIVGYWCFVALKAELFEAAKSGKMLDGDIRLQDVERLDRSGTYKMYFDNIALVPKFRNSALKGVGSKKLVNSFLDHLKDLARDGILFDEVCATAHTEEGIRLCEMFGLFPLDEHERIGGTVYHARTDAIRTGSERLQHLVSAYAK